MNNSWLEHIYKQLHREGYLWARQCCFYNDEYAKEVMQLVYLKIIEEKARYKQQSAVKTWFFSVIRYTAIDYLRSQRTFVSMDILENIAMEVAESLADEVNYQSLLQQLPDRQHQVLLLSFYHGLSLNEVAEVLNISLGSVRTHYDRGKKKFKSILINQRKQWPRMIN